MYSFSSSEELSASSCSGTYSSAEVKSENYQTVTGGEAPDKTAKEEQIFGMTTPSSQVSATGLKEEEKKKGGSLLKPADVCKNKKLSVPIIPPQVDLIDLVGGNGTKLYDKKEVKLIKEALNGLKPIRYYSKNGKRLSNALKGQSSISSSIWHWLTAPLHPRPLKRWSILKIEKKYYAAYAGKKKGKTLGSGGFAKTILFQDIDTGEWHVGKKIKMPNISPKSKPENKIIFKMSLREAAILATLDRLPALPPKHKQTITESALENIRETEPFIQRKRIAAGKNKHTAFILMKYHPGIELSKFVQQNTLSHHQLFTIFENMRAAAHYLLQKNILHRDIKPANFIINPLTLEVTLIDFNLSIKLNDNSKSILTNDCVGTPGYFHVERVKDQYKYSEKTEAHALISSFLCILDQQVKQREKDSKQSQGNLAVSYRKQFINLFTGTKLSKAFQKTFKECKKQAVTERWQISNETESPSTKEISETRGKMFKKISTFENIREALEAGKKQLLKKEEGTQLDQKQPSSPHPIRARDYRKILQSEGEINELRKYSEVLLCDSYKASESKQPKISHTLMIKSLQSKGVKIQPTVEISVESSSDEISAGISPEPLNERKTSASKIAFGPTKDKDETHQSGTSNTQPCKPTEPTLSNEDYLYIRDVINFDIERLIKKYLSKKTTKQNTRKSQKNTSDNKHNTSESSIVFPANDEKIINTPANMAKERIEALRQYRDNLMPCYLAPPKSSSACIEELKELRSKIKPINSYLPSWLGKRLNSSTSAASITALIVRLENKKKKSPLLFFQNPSMSAKVSIPHSTPRSFKHRNARK